MCRKWLRLIAIAVFLAMFSVEPLSAAASGFFAPRARRAQFGYGRTYRHRRYDRRLDARWQSLLFRQAEERRACRYYRYSFGCANLDWRQREERRRLERLLRFGYRW